MAFSKKIVIPSLLAVCAAAIFTLFKMGDKPEENEVYLDEVPTAESALFVPDTMRKDFPEGIDRITELFSTGPNKLPIVETITYKPNVDWLEGKSAWIADYATHYATSRHFIARSLNGKKDYFTQKIATGDKFNVLRTDKKIEFYFLVDLSSCKMGFYYIDQDTHEHVLLKVYPVGVGRLAQDRVSGSLTPIGKYSLGKKVAIYPKGKKGTYMGEEVEMIRIFGTRWIPFAEEIKNCSAGAKGFGMHGVPWREKQGSQQEGECEECIGKYDSDGCIRLLTSDIEEIFAIILTKPSYIEIVRNLSEADSSFLSGV